MGNFKYGINCIGRICCLLLVLGISACSSGDGDGFRSPANDGIETPAADLTGLWVLTELNGLAAPPNLAYILLENSSSFGVDSTFYFSNANANCYDSNSLQLEKTNTNEYRDPNGDYATILVRNNVLTFAMTLDALGTQVQKYDPVIALSAQDLSVCPTVTRNKSGVVEFALGGVTAIVD